MCGDDYAGDVPLGLLFFVLYLGFLLPHSSLVKWRRAQQALPVLRALLLCRGFTPEPTSALWA